MPPGALIIEPQRVEHRLGAADANPYLALAAAIGAGLYGIEKGWQPEPLITGNAQDFVGGGADI